MNGFMAMFRKELTQMLRDRGTLFFAFMSMTPNRTSSPTGTASAKKSVPRSRSICVSSLRNMAKKPFMTRPRRALLPRPCRASR